MSHSTRHHLARFIAAAIVMGLGTAWICACKPLLSGVPVTWGNAPLLLTTLPGFFLLIAGFVLSNRR